MLLGEMNIRVGKIDNVMGMFGEGNKFISYLTEFQFVISYSSTSTSTCVSEARASTCNI